MAADAESLQDVQRRIRADVAERFPYRCPFLDRPNSSHGDYRCISMGAPETPDPVRFQQFCTREKSYRHCDWYSAEQC